MKIVIVFNFVLLALIFSGCRQELSQTTTTPAKNTKVQREVFDANKYPELTAIGRIIFLGQKQCTLALVAEDIAVTAGHCFLEELHLSDMTKDLDPSFAKVIFRADGVLRLENIYVKRVLKAKMKPDYAIVKLSRKIDAVEIEPIKFQSFTLEELRSREANLGCAGFNGDTELGDSGFTMTITRNIRIISEGSSSTRIDTNCISTHGGSGGAFFEARRNPGSNEIETLLLGVVWGVTDDQFNKNGELIEEIESITSITLVSVFANELNEIINQN